MFVFGTSLLLSAVYLMIWYREKSFSEMHSRSMRRGPQLQQGAFWLYTLKKKPNSIRIAKSLAREAMEPPALIETGLAKTQAPLSAFPVASLFWSWAEVDHFQRSFLTWIILFVYIEWNFSNGTFKMWDIIAIHVQG